MTLNVAQQDIQPNFRFGTAAVSHQKQPVGQSLRYLNIGHINVRSLRHKSHEVQELITSHSLSVLAISETWLDETDNDSLLNINGYHLFRRDRSLRRGGGVCIYVREDLNASLDTRYSKNPAIEIIWIKISSQIHKNRHCKDILIGCIYRPPAASNEFWSQLESTVEGAEAEELVILGDLNVDFLQKTNAMFRSLKHTLMLPLGLKNLIKEPTRYAKNVKSSLDVILTNSDRIYNGAVADNDLSDHCLITAKMEILSSPEPETSLPKNSGRSSYLQRDMRKFDPVKFQEELQGNGLTNFSSKNVDAMWQEWLLKFHTALDTVAPFKRFTVKKKYSPFMNDSLLQIIQRRKAVYRKWRKSNCQDDSLLGEFRQLRSQGNNLYRQLRNTYYLTACRNYRSNPRLLWSTINEVTGRKRMRKTIPVTASVLSQYFQQLTYDKNPSYILPEGPSALEDMDAFQEIETEKMAQYLAALNPFKAPGPDCLLPSMLKALSLELAPSLTIICNVSLRNGTVPQAFKDANITPLLKPGKNDILNPSSYRGVSLNAIMSKVLEKVVQEQLNNLFEVKKPLHDHQFGFRKKRCTSHLLTVAVNDWLLARDNGQSTAIAFIDLSKAFDQIRHQAILLDLHSVGISGTALKWFQSYLQGRRQRVITDSGKSKSQFITTMRGVPQGSILGPTLFNLSVRFIPEVAARHSSKLHMFADDKTLYSSHKSLTTAARAVSQALLHVNSALEEKGLSINTTKTVAMFLTTNKFKSPASENVNVMLNGQSLEVVSNTRCLGVVIDDQLCWKAHVDFVCAKVSRKIGALRRARRLLSPSAKRLFVLGVIQPDLEYCAAAFMTTLSYAERTRLERLHRRAIRTMADAVTTDDTEPAVGTSEPTMQQLMQRWIIVAATLVFECRKEPEVADCLKNLFKDISSNYRTRGKINGSLEIMQHKRKSGTNSISNRLSLLWNSLPKELRFCTSVSSFKSSLSMFLKDPANLSCIVNLLFGNVSSV